MMFPKKKWLHSQNQSETKIPECPEEHIQKAVNQYLDLLRVDYIRIPDNVFRWVKMNAPVWFQKYFFKVFGGRPDNTIIVPIGNGIAIAFLLELKTQDSSGKEVGKLHGKQKQHKDEWIICRSLNAAMDKIDWFLKEVKQINEIYKERG